MAKVQEIEREARFIVDNNATVRQAAKEFGISKSTIHIHMVKVLPRIDASLYKDVREVLDTNKAERHIRGGKATKERFLKQREN